MEKKGEFNLETFFFENTLYIWKYFVLKPDSFLLDIMYRWPIKILATDQLSVKIF